METAIKDDMPTDASKKRKRAIFFGFGTLVLGALAFLGIKQFNKSKTDENDNNTEIPDRVDANPPLQSGAHHPSNSRLPASDAGDAFPLRPGSKGNKVRALQQALIRTYGAGILPKHGADGSFGKELESALRSKQYGIPLNQSEFLRITGTQKQTQKAPPAQKAGEQGQGASGEPLLKLNPSIIARGIYLAVLAKDFNAAITLLKSIPDAKTYSLVSYKIKAYRINGVHQTLVNALLGSFKEKSQREMFLTIFKKIGLKYNGTKWSA